MRPEADSNAPTPTAPMRIAPAIPPATVQLWRIGLTRAAEEDHTLSGWERARAADIREPGSRRRFTLTRSVVRRILAGYLGCDPAEVPIFQRCVTCGGPHGRPWLGDVRTSLRFSVSHSGDLAAVAISSDAAIGVDVESGTGLLSPLLVAGRLARSETAAVRTARDDERRRTFLRVWTRKEAYLKATGEGLARPMSSFGVSTGERAELLWADGDDAVRWRLEDLSLPGPATGAVAFPAGYRLQIKDY